MNQTSDKFFDEMLKDNMKEQPAGNFQEQLADMIDKRISETMKKFEDQFSQIQPQTDPAEAATKAAAVDVAKAAAADAAREQKFQEVLDSVDAGKTESGLLTED